MGSLAQAAEVIEIGCKGVISNAGQYKLVEDCVLDKTDAVGISIDSAEDVELDLDGHTISGPGCIAAAEDRPVGIRVLTSSRVRVANGILKKLVWGVMVMTSDHSDFNKLTLVENCLGIELRESNENKVSYNDISRNERQGVAVNGSNTPNASANNNHVTFNVIDQNSSPREEIMQTGGGVVLTGGPGKVDSNVIAFNAISGNRQNGVVLSVSHKNIVASNLSP
jgi:parallel beta-helix repeat protein